MLSRLPAAKQNAGRPLIFQYEQNSQPGYCRRSQSPSKDPRRKSEFGSTMQPGCIPANSTRRSYPKRQGRSQASGAPPLAPQPWSTFAPAVASCRHQSVFLTSTRVFGNSESADQYTSPIQNGPPQRNRREG